MSGTSTEPPTFDELASLSRKRTDDKRIGCWFDHGTVLFSGQIDRRRADIVADLWESRDILPAVTRKLKDQYGEYLKRYPEVLEGGAVGKFGPTVIHCHVRLEDADEWLQRIFDVVREPQNLESPQDAADFLNAICGPFLKSIDDDSEQTHVETGERLSASLSRTGQDRFSRAVKDNYQRKCCFPECSVDDQRLLVGAHIDRWSDSPEFRGDLSNGLCLCVLHDKAFEVGLFVLTDDCLVSVQIKDSTSTWVSQDLAAANGKPIRRGRIPPSVDAIRQHRKRTE